MSAPAEDKLLFMLQCIYCQCNSLFLWEVLCEVHHIPLFCEERKIIENDVWEICVINLYMLGLINSYRYIYSLVRCDFFCCSCSALFVYFFLIRPWFRWCCSHFRSVEKNYHWMIVIIYVVHTYIHVCHKDSRMGNKSDT